MNLAPGLAVLNLHRWMGSKGSIHPVLIWDEDNVVLVDAGFPGQEYLIKTAVEEAGADFGSLSHIIITHHDLDHRGSLAAVQGLLKNKPKILAHEDGVPYIHGEILPFKFTPERIEAIEKDPGHPFSGSLRESLEKIKAKVDIPLSHEERLDLCGGISVIHTPGHIPDHICLYLHRYKIVVAGDAMILEGETLKGPDPYYTFDMEEAKASLRRLLDYEITGVICYHGGYFSGDVRAVIENISPYSTQ